MWETRTGDSRESSICRGIKNKHIDIYSKYVLEYDQFISKQDYQKNLFSALEDIFNFYFHNNTDNCNVHDNEINNNRNNSNNMDKNNSKKDNVVVVELGGGTGRFSCMFSGHFNTIISLDISQTMLETATNKHNKDKVRNCVVIQADHRSIPLRDGIADVVVAAWSLSYLKAYHEKTWKQEINKVLGEVKRITRPNCKESVMVIVETLGTARTEPHRGGSWYYKYLGEIGFQFKWIRTDYLFEDATEAEEQMRFFFGNVVANRVRSEGVSIVPECTGIWWICIDDITLRGIP